MELVSDELLSASLEALLSSLDTWLELDSSVVEEVLEAALTVPLRLLSVTMEERRMLSMASWFS